MYEESDVRFTILFVLFRSVPKIRHTTTYERRQAITCNLDEIFHVDVITPLLITIERESNVFQLTLFIY